MPQQPPVQLAARYPFLESFGLTLSSWFKNVPRSWKVSLLAFLAGRVAFSLWGAVIWLMRLMPSYKGDFYYDIMPVLNGIPGALLGMWQRWDGIHYQRIAMFGYEDPLLSAFFPLFPMLGRLVASVTGVDSLLALIIVSNLAFLAAIWLLYQIVCEEFSSKLAFDTLFALIIFPSAFFFYSVYPQSLLLMLVLLAYRSARHEKWILSGLAAFCAGLTHLTSAPLSILLGWEALQSIKNKRKASPVTMLLAPLMNLAGIGCFLLWRYFAGFPAYQNLLKQQWTRDTLQPLEGLLSIGKNIVSTPFDFLHTLSWISIFVFFFILAAIVWSFKKIPGSMWIYQVGVLGVFLVTINVQYPLLGILRYPLVMFPLFVEIASIGTNKGWRLVKFLVCVALSLICSAMFFMWKMVA